MSDAQDAVSCTADAVSDAQDAMSCTTDAVFVFDVTSQRISTR
ncbi:hypothetical protein [Haloechinothrix halophila]|nr:hypothetical protein [Haloechinothrix halophila]